MPILRFVNNSGTLVCAVFAEHAGNRPLERWELIDNPTHQVQTNNVQAHLQSSLVLVRGPGLLYSLVAL